MLYSLLAFTHVYSQVDTTQSSTLSLIFAGDIMGHDSQIKAAYDHTKKAYDYEHCFKYVKPFIQQADIAIANLEVTLAGKPFKGYPQFSSPDNLALAASNAGFNVMLTANNHSLDRGQQGLERTIDILDSFKIIRTGTFKDTRERESRYPLIIEKNGIRLAILNITYGTNGLKEKKPNIVNRIDTMQIKKDLVKAHAFSPDFTIVTIHWGAEYERNENWFQRKLASFFIRENVDAVIGSHPHVVQPIKEIYPIENDTNTYKIVLFSLGNFISNQRTRFRDGGIIFKLDLIKSGNETRIKEYSYLPTWVYKNLTSQGTKFHIVPANSFLHGLGREEIRENAFMKMKQFYEDTKNHLSGITEHDYVYREE